MVSLRIVGYPTVVLSLCEWLARIVGNCELINPTRTFAASIESIWSEASGRSKAKLFKESVFSSRMLGSLIMDLINEQISNYCQYCERP